MKRSNKGFTLAEMLIVVAIIGVLVAIITTTITSALERAREATDLANVRSAISEISIYATTDDRTDMPTYIKYDSKNKYYYTFVKAKQKETGWQSSNIEKNSEGNAVLNGATISAGNFSKNNRAYKIYIYSGVKKVVIKLITTNKSESVAIDDMYYRTNEYVKTY